MDVTSKLSSEELELKAKYKVLRKLKRCVDKMCSSRKRHFHFQTDPGDGLKVLSAQTASDQLRTQSVSLQPKRAQNLTQGFKKPECWVRNNREGIPSRPKFKAATSAKTPAAPGTPQMYVERPMEASASTSGIRDMEECIPATVFSFQTEEKEEKAVKIPRDKVQYVRFVNSDRDSGVPTPTQGCFQSSPLTGKSHYQYAVFGIAGLHPDALAAESPNDLEEVPVSEFNVQRYGDMENRMEQDNDDENEDFSLAVVF